MNLQSAASDMGTQRAEGDARMALRTRYRAVRDRTEALCTPLAIEDYGVQSMPDVSPAKWHLAHTAWFFETFLLRAFVRDYRPFHTAFEYLFNSYYESEGTPYPRDRRGLLARPTVEEVYRYRAHVDRAMEALLDQAGAPQWTEIDSRTTLGLHHEQQHQELLLTDIKHVYAINPLHPSYRAPRAIEQGTARPLDWHEYEGGIGVLGHDDDGFAFDNESPAHRVLRGDFALAGRAVTNDEYMAFIDDGGYQRPTLWLADGWRCVQEQGWQAPLYWERHDGGWQHMTLSGMQPLIASAPVCHVSYYEADAYARWAGFRLPSEAEWEHVARACPIAGNFYESERLQPTPASNASTGPMQLYGDVWEWTASPYSAYPGYRPAAGALGEYNGKFMCNQYVLRGGSCVSPQSHLRATYRNFFQPDRRWQFSGIRLAADR